MSGLLWLLLATSPAHAEGAKLTGSWRVVSIQHGETTMGFPEALAKEAHDLVYGRWLWAFSAGELTVTAQAVHRASAEAGEPRDYRFCESSVTVDVGWSNGRLLLPSIVQTEYQAGRYDRRDSPLFVEDCNIRLNAMQGLQLLPAPPGSPDDSVLLRTSDSGIALFLVPDRAELNLKTLIE